MISRVVAVGPWDGHRIWVRFDDEVVGEIDLAEFLDLDSPLFRPLKDRQVFETVRVSPFGEVAWYIPGAEQGLDLCPDTLYMELTGLTEDEMAEKWGVKPPSRYRQWRRRRWANRGPLAKRWYRLKRRWVPFGWVPSGVGQQTLPEFGHRKARTLDPVAGRAK